MQASDVRAALVAAGIMSQQEADGIPDAVVVKLAPMIQPANADEKTPSPPPPPKETEKKPVENADDEETDEQAMADDPKDDKKPMNFKDAKRAFAPMIAKAVSDALKANKSDIARIEQSHKRITDEAAKTAAVAFCDRLRTQKKLTHGMNSDSLAVEILVEADKIPGEYTFSDSAGKKNKGTLGDKIREFMGRIPKIENWGEIHGGGKKKPDDQKAHDEELLTTAFNSFSDQQKRILPLKSFIEGYHAQRKHFDEDLTAEDYLAQMESK